MYDLSKPREFPWSAEKHAIIDTQSNSVNFFSGFQAYEAMIEQMLAIEPLDYRALSEEHQVEVTKFTLACARMKFGDHSHLLDFVEGELMKVGPFVMWHEVIANKFMHQVMLRMKRFAVLDDGMLSSPNAEPIDLEIALRMEKDINEQMAEAIKREDEYRLRAKNGPESLGDILEAIMKGGKL